jgi:hypothetical protein
MIPPSRWNVKHSITHEQMEVFAQLLETVKQQQTLSTEEFNNLHAQFHDEDARGVRWTVGIQTRNWHRREQGKWLPGAPPEELQVNEEIATALWELLSKQWSATSSSTPPAKNAVCNRCGAQLKPGTRFCQACGSPVI